MNNSRKEASALGKTFIALLPFVLSGGAAVYATNEGRKRTDPYYRASSLTQDQAIKESNAAKEKVLPVDTGYGPETHYGYWNKRNAR